MKAVGFKTEEQETIWQLVAAILHLVWTGAYTGRGGGGGVPANPALVDQQFLSCANQELNNLEINLSSLYNVFSLSFTGKC